MGEVQRGVAIFDLHYPKHDKRVWHGITQFIEDFCSDIVVFGGDALDMEAMNHWAADKRRLVETKRLLQEYEGFTNDILRPLTYEHLGGKSSVRKIFMLGNHEGWVEKYLDKHPEVEGLLEIEKNIPFAELGWEVYQPGEIVKVGHLHITHGYYVNTHNAKKTADVFGKNVIYGHGHSFQAHTTTTPIGVESHMAMQLPCVCNLNPEYAKNRPNSWVHGFGVFYIWPNGNFNVYPVIASKGRFVAPNGEMYPRKD